MTTETAGTEKNAVGLRVWAPAKINLFFEILFKRQDGFHEIQTVAAPIELCDELEFVVRNKKNGAKIEKTSIVECVDEAGFPVPGVPTDERNLIVRAAKAFDDAFGEPTPVEIRVLKRIPSQAGLGGGSSDAAATLFALNELRGRPLSNERLREIGGRLGSDVPLFLIDGASVGRSRGELVEPFELSEIWLVVLKPGEGLSTPEVFRRYAATPPDSKRALADFCAAVSRPKTLNRENDAIENDGEKEKKRAVEEDWEIGRNGENSGFSTASAVGGALFNRLETVASTIWGGVRRYRTVLSATENVLGVQMSGSGTAFFAIYPNETAARAAAEALRTVCVDGETIAVARTLPRTFRAETLVSAVSKF